MRKKNVSFPILKIIYTHMHMHTHAHINYLLKSINLFRNNVCIAHKSDDTNFQNNHYSHNSDKHKCVEACIRKFIFVWIIITQFIYANLQLHQLTLHFFQVEHPFIPIIIIKWHFLTYKLWPVWYIFVFFFSGNLAWQFNLAHRLEYTRERDV